MLTTSDRTEVNLSGEEDNGVCVDCVARNHCFFYEINADECHYDVENREDNQKWNDERKYGKQWK